MAAAVPAPLQGFCQGMRGGAEPALEGFTPVDRSFVATESESGIGVALRCVVRTREQWDAFRALARPGAFPDSAADFRREMLLAATLGARGNTGFAIAFGPVLAHADTIVAAVAGTAPVSGVEGDLVTTPAAVVRVAARPGPVLWMERE